MLGALLPCAFADSVRISHASLPGSERLSLMGYGCAALHTLLRLTDSYVPHGGRILDIGDQDIVQTTLDDLQPIMAKLHGETATALVHERFRPGEKWKVTDLFEGSPYRHQSVDLYAGKATITADLNTYCVPEPYRGVFDIVTNLGSTEHVFDQTNVFRCIHDFAKVGAIFLHSVPATGYYNHALYNYHPLFFVFLARANGYEIVYASISPPHLEHTIPISPSLHGSDAWTRVRNLSAIINFVLRKVVDAPFQLFSDYDQAVMGEHQQQDAWTTMMQTRYDLRVHS